MHNVFIKGSKAKEDFLDNIHSHEGGVVYGLAEGY